MALVLKDRVKETTTTSGTGTITLAGAVSGFRSFSVIGDGNTTYYTIVDPTTSDWEVGIGTYTSSGTTLSRTTVLQSSNSDNLVNFAANQKDVFVTYPAERSVYADAAGTSIVSAAGTGAGDFTTLTSSSTTTLNGTTIPASKTLVDTDSSQTLTSKTVSGLILNDGFTEEVFAVSGTTPALSPTNGSIQTWTLSGNSTPSAGTWNAGQSITLMVDDGTAYTITWTTLAVTWKSDAGVAPTLNTSGYTAIVLWKVATTIYGARVGDA